MTKAALAKAIADAALLRGTFTLRSGRTSSYYLDKYLFTTRPELLREIAKLFAARVRAISDERSGGDAAHAVRGVQRLAGAELGGIPLVTATGMETGLPFVFVRNAKKDYGTAKQLEGRLEKGERVILLEDIATTAGQALEAVRVLQDAGAEVAATLAVIDRQEGAAENMAKAGVRFEALFTKGELGIT